MDLDQDDVEYRAAVLAGRARALEEMAVFVKRLALAVPPTADAGTRLKACMRNWFELASWLNQAAVESVDEMAVFRREPEARGTQGRQTPALPRPGAGAPPTQDSDLP